MKETTLTCKEVLSLAEEELKNAGIAGYRSDARLIAGHFTGWDFSQLIGNLSSALSTDTVRRINEAVERRKTRIPLQYILGVQSFMGLDFFCGEGVLIPRFDTETLVEAVLEKDKTEKFSTAIELCTGTGCISASLAHYGSFSRIYASDISEDALVLAEKNIGNLGLGQRITLLRGSLWEPFNGIKADAVIANPPYITTDEIEKLDMEVLHEPRLALDGGPDGLLFYRQIIKGAKEHLNDGGFIFFETGFDQKEAVSKLLKEAGFTDIETKNDLGGNHRVVLGRNCASGGSPRA